VTAAAARGTTRVRLRGKIDLIEGFIDASFTAAKKGLCHRSYKARQQQNHGNRRPPQSSSRRARGLCFTT
jgi:hypothetical protein